MAKLEYCQLYILVHFLVFFCLAVHFQNLSQEFFTTLFYLFTAHSSLA